jgi:hypothetical protein
LLAESAKVRLHGHGYIVPAACPALRLSTVEEALAA